MNQAIYNKVSKILSSVAGCIESDITPETKLDSLVDSMEIVEFVMELEQEFSLDIPDEDAENLTTVAKVVEYLEENAEG